MRRSTVNAANAPAYTRLPLVGQNFFLNFPYDIARHHLPTQFPLICFLVRIWMRRRIASDYPFASALSQGLLQDLIRESLEGKY